MKPKIYIASPFTSGDQLVNIRASIDVASQILRKGYIPFSPLSITALHHMLVPEDYDVWMDFCLEWVKACDIVLRMEGESNGADMEVAEAQKCGIPIIYSIEELDNMCEFCLSLSLELYEDFTCKEDPLIYKECSECKSLFYSNKWGNEVKINRNK